MDDRTARPVVCSQHTDQFIIENDETNSYTEAESELSLGSRSFLHRVNDQVQKRQKQSSAEAILSQEAYKILLLPLHSDRVDCCLSLSCVRTEFVEVVRLTDHDASFVSRHFQQ